MKRTEAALFLAFLGAACLAVPVRAAMLPPEDLGGVSDDEDVSKEETNVYPDDFMGPIPPGSCRKAECPGQGTDPLSGSTFDSTLGAAADACTPWRIPCAWPPPEGTSGKDGLSQVPPGDGIRQSPAGEEFCAGGSCVPCAQSPKCQDMKSAESAAQEKLKAEDERKKKGEKDKAAADLLAKEAAAEKERQGECLNCRKENPVTASAVPQTPSESDEPGSLGPMSASGPAGPEDEPGAGDDSIDPASYGDQVDGYAGGPALGFEIAGLGGSAGKPGGTSDPMDASEPIGGGTFQEILDTSRNLRGGGDASSAAGSLSRMHTEAGVSADESDSGLDALWGKFRRLWNEDSQAPVATPTEIKPVPFQGVKNDPS